ncbi:single-stranded DNA-binding protein [Nonomuraea sp. NPDC050478]|uniref:single-stranded DNA-binding protein n=1 Tax=Nonomuraea sp. NPDC050478 TaxID=3364365 RepID=UPI0037BADD08
MDIQVSITGRIAFPPRFFPAKGDSPAMWSARLEVNGPPTPGRDGSPYVPTRAVEVITYGLAAIRASESYRKGHLLVVQGCDMVARSFESKDRAGHKTVRSITKITATAIGLCSRYSMVSESTSPSQISAASPRMVQGASAADEAQPAAAA